MKKRKAAPKRSAHRAKMPRSRPRSLGQQTRAIAEIKVGKRHRRDFGDLSALAASINDRGALLQPIVITEKNELIAGERRLKAWQISKFKGERIPVHVVTIDSIIAGEWDENAARKEFTPEEAVLIKRELERQLGGAARERQLAGKKADPKHKGQAGDQASRAAGFDRRTIEKAEKILAAAERDPQKFGSLREQMNKTGKVNGSFKRLQVLQLSAAIKLEPPPLPMQGPYRTFVADVPWPGELDDERPAERGRAFFPYATMSIKAIAEMGPAIQQICHPEGAWLWFWIPNFHLAKGAQLEILKAWGFEPTGVIRTWTKPHFGNGQLCRGQTEQVLLCRRGKPPYGVLTNQSTWLQGAASGEHSGKPASFFADVETLTPAPRYAYLFAGRSIPEKWDGHGDRVGKISPADARAAETKFLAECDRRGIASPAEKPAPLISIEAALDLVERGKLVPDVELTAELRAAKLIKGGKKLRLTADGVDRLRDHRDRNAQLSMVPALDKATPAGTSSLVNPKLLPGQKQIAAIADRAEKRSRRRAAG